MKRFGNFWYPYRSREVRDICEHLTPEEARRLSAQSWSSGALVGGLMGGLGFFFVYWVLQSTNTNLGAYLPLGLRLFVLVALANPVGLLFGWIVAMPIRRRTLRMLGESEYARQMGFTSESLGLYRQGWKPMAAALATIPLVVAGVSVAVWWTTHPDEAQARLTLARMARAYANCRSYRDAGVVETRFTEKKGVRTEEQHFTTAFKRPGRFRFEYTSNDGPQKPSRYIICSQPKSSPSWWDWISSNTNDVNTWWDVQPGVKTVKSLGYALAGATGVSGGSAPTTAALLLPGEVWGSLTELSDPRLVADEKVDGAECFRIEGSFGTLPTTLWIDKATYLLRRRAQRITIPDARVEQTTTYQPVIDQQVADELLAFNPPAP